MEKYIVLVSDEENPSVTKHEQIVESNSPKYAILAFIKTGLYQIKKGDLIYSELLSSYNSRQPAPNMN